MHDFPVLPLQHSARLINYMFQNMVHPGGNGLPLTARQQRRMRQKNNAMGRTWVL